MRKYKLFISACLGMLMFQTLTAQDPFQTRCGTVMDPTSSYSPVLRDGNDSLLIIPVVFHIIHQEGAENISRAQVLQALQQLNDDFNRRNGDTTDIPKVFQDIRGNANIEFRLAKKDPAGHCSDGIHRVYSPLTSQYGNWTTYDDDFIWDHTRYLNIFVVKDLLPNDVGGFYFTLPGLANLQPLSGTGNPNLDFISMRYDVLGFSVNGLPLASHGHILTEEAGHSLALQHIWVQPGCGTDDGVTDTPLQDDAHYAECLEFPVISCNNGPNGDNFQNFMDYTNCKNMFTAGQVSRMRTCIADNAWRQQLCSMQNLEFTGVLDTVVTADCARAPQASFGYGNYLGLYYAGKPVSFYDASSWAPDSWKWTFEGGDPLHSTASSPNVVFQLPGQHKIKLLVSNAFGADSVEQVITIREELFYSNMLPLETFDDTGLHEQLKKHTLANANPWEPVLLDLATGNFAMYLDSCKQWASSFETHTFQLGDNPTPNRKLEFKVAHATAFGGTAMVNSSLRIVAKKPEWNDWVDYFGLDLFPANSVIISPGIFSNTMRTATVGANVHFVPSAAQWKKLSFDLPETLTGEVVFAFHWGAFENATSFKGLYLDSIAVRGLTSAATGVEKASGWTIIPNPTTGHMESHLATPPETPGLVRIFNLQGQLIEQKSQYAQSESIDISALPNGVYLVTLQDKYSIRRARVLKEAEK